MTDDFDSYREPSNKEILINEERIKAIFLNKIKNKNDWKLIRATTFKYNDLSFIDEVILAYKYFLEIEDFETCNEFYKIRNYILSPKDKEKYDEINFKEMVSDFSVELLRNGDVETAKRVRDELIGDIRDDEIYSEEAREGLIKKFREVYDKFAEFGLNIDLEKIEEIIKDSSDHKNQNNKKSLVA